MHHHHLLYGCAIDRNLQFNVEIERLVQFSFCRKFVVFRAVIALLSVIGCVANPCRPLKGEQVAERFLLDIKFIRQAVFCALCSSSAFACTSNCRCSKPKCCKTCLLYESVMLDREDADWPCCCLFSVTVDAHTQNKNFIARFLYSRAVVSSVEHL